MPGHRAGQRGKRWCFTINNYTEEDTTAMKENITEESVKYAIVGIETAANTNTPHLQGFVHFLERKSLAHMKRTFNAIAHYEIARGTDKENEKYCTKDGNILLQVGQPAS